MTAPDRLYGLPGVGGVPLPARQFQPFYPEPLYRLVPIEEDQ